MGVFTDVDSTQAMHRSLAVPCLTTAPLTRSAARNTESNALRHCSSLVLQHRSGRWPANADQRAIEPTEGIQRKSAGRLGGAGIGQVGRERDGTVRSQLAHRFGQQLGSSSDEDHTRSLGDELLGRCAPEPGAGRRDQERAVRQAKIHDQILTPSREPRRRPRALRDGPADHP